MSWPLSVGNAYPVRTYQGAERYFNRTLPAYSKRHKLLGEDCRPLITMNEPHCVIRRVHHPQYSQWVYELYPYRWEPYARPNEWHGKFAATLYPPMGDGTQTVVVGDVYPMDGGAMRFLRATTGLYPGMCYGPCTPRTPLPRVDGAVLVFDTETGALIKERSTHRLMAMRYTSPERSELRKRIKPMLTAWRDMVPFLMSEMLAQSTASKSTKTMYMAPDAAAQLRAAVNSGPDFDGVIAGMVELTRIAYQRIDNWECFKWEYADGKGYHLYRKDWSGRNVRVRHPREDEVIASALKKLNEYTEFSKPDAMRPLPMWSSSYPPSAVRYEEKEN